MFCTLFTIYILKLFGWIDNSIKLTSYLLLFIFIFLYLIKNYKNTKINNIVISYLVFFLFIFIFIFNTVVQGFSSYSSVQTIGMYLYNFGLGLFVFLMYKEIDFIKLLKLFSIFIIISILVDFIFLYDFYIADFDIGFIKHIEKNVSTVYYGRGCGFFSDPTAHATVLVMYPAFIVVAFKYFNLSKKTTLSMLVLSFIAIILSTSKAGIILYLVEFLFLFLFISKNRFYENLIIKTPFLIIIFISLIGLIVYYLYSIKVEIIINMVNFFLNPNQAETLTQRYYTYRIALNIINENILTGIGFGNPQKIVGLSIHNSLLQLISEQGMTGIIFIIYLFIVFPYLVFIKLNFNYLKIVFIVLNIIFIAKLMIVDVFHTHELFVYLFGMGTLYQISQQLKKGKA
jgi:O-antigen ligase